MPYQLSRIVAGPFRYTIWRPRVIGAENIPATSGAILPANHLSKPRNRQIPAIR